MSEEQALSVDDVLEPSKGEESPPVEVVETQAEVATPEQPATPAEKPKDEPWHIRAVMDEREKRQAAQKEAEQLRKRLAEFEDKQKPKTSVFEDEGKFRNELASELQTQVFNQTLNISQAMMEDKIGEAELAQKVEAFRGLAEQDAALWDQFRSSSHPYRELVKIVDNRAKAKELENIDDYKARLRAEVEAEVLAKLKGQGQKAKPSEDITPSLASSRSVAGTTESVSLSSIDDVLSN